MSVLAPIRGINDTDLQTLNHQLAEVLSGVSCKAEQVGLSAELKFEPFLDDGQRWRLAELFAERASFANVMLNSARVELFTSAQLDANCEAVQITDDLSAAFDDDVQNMFRIRDRMRKGENHADLFRRTGDIEPKDAVARGPKPQSNRKKRPSKRATQALLLLTATELADRVERFEREELIDAAMRRDKRRGTSTEGQRRKNFDRAVDGLIKSGDLVEGTDGLLHVPEES